MRICISRPEPKPGRRSVFPRLRPTPYPSRIAPLDLARPPTTVPRLPNEIIDLILENSGEKATLRSWCLVASSFFAPARRVLYHRVFVQVESDLYGGTPSDQWILLLETLAAHPHLAALVRHFDLGLFPVGGAGDIPGFEAGFGLAGNLLTSAFARALQACQSLVGLSLTSFPAFANNSVLKIVTVTAPPLRELSIYLYQAGEEDEAGYLNLLRSQPHLKSLTVGGALPSCDGEDPLPFALENLNFSGSIRGSSFFDLVTVHSHSSLLSLSFPSLNPAPVLARFSRLASLTLDGLAANWTSILVQFPLLPLRHLEIRSYTFPSPSLLSFLPPTLEDVELPDGLPPTEVLSFVESGQCPLLRSFEMMDEFQKGTFSPFDQAALARACHRRGLVLEQPEPQDNEQIEELEELEWRGRSSLLLKKMRPLESYWMKAA